MLINYGENEKEKDGVMVKQENAYKIPSFYFHLCTMNITRADLAFSNTRNHVFCFEVSVFPEDAVFLASLSVKISFPRTVPYMR